MKYFKSYIKESNIHQIEQFYLQKQQIKQGECEINCVGGNK